MPPSASGSTTIPFPQYRAAIPLVWRSGVCAQLRISGRCPAARGQVLLSRRMAVLTGWHLGQHLRFAGWPDLTVTGLYGTPAQGRAYWFGRGSLYFPTIDPRNPSGSSPVDAFFTPRATLEQAPPQQQGTAVVDDLLNESRLTGSDVPQLASAMTAFSASPALQQQQVLVTTGIPATLQAVQASWRAVEIPVVLITAQLLAACLLLLFLTVTDAIDTRGHEVSLAKLRGRSRAKRTMWSRRAQEYQAKIASGDPASIAEVVRDLYRNVGQPEQSYSERQIYQAALDRLVREFAAVERIDESTATQRVEQLLTA